MFLYTYTSQSGSVSSYKNSRRGPLRFSPGPLFGRGRRPEPRSGCVGGVAMGRRAARSDEARTEIVHMRLTVPERLRVEQRAAAAGLTVSAWAARAVTSSEVTVEVARTSTLPPGLIAELKRIGNNVNQIAAALNTGLHVPAAEIVAKMRDLLRSLVRDETLIARINECEGPEGRAMLRRILGNRVTSGQAAGDFVPPPPLGGAAEPVGRLRNRHGLDAAAGVDRGRPDHGSAPA